MGKKRNMGKLRLVQWATNNGFTLDRYGNFVKKNESGIFRFKLNPNKVRYEEKKFGRWVRIKSAFYKDITLSEDGKMIHGFKK